MLGGPRALSVERVCGARPPPDGSEGKKRWAEAGNAWSPRPVATAHEHLEKHWGTRAWKPLTPLAKFNFANAWVERNHVDRDPEHDPAMGFSRIMTGVEDELHMLLSSLESLRDALPARGPTLRAALTEDLRAATPRDKNGDATHWTLGAYARLFERLAKSSERTLNQQGLSSVVSLGRDTTWLRAMKELRDPAAHGGYAGHLPAIRKVLFGFFEGKGGEVGRIVGAREAVKGRVKEVKKALEAR